MATAICATGFKGGLGSSFHGSWGSSVSGEDYPMLVKSVPNVRVAKPIKSAPMMKNVNEGKGLFAPVVVVTRQIIGKKRFNQLRGKAIALHSQVSLVFPFTLQTFLDQVIFSVCLSSIKPSITFYNLVRYGVSIIRFLYFK